MKDRIVIGTRGSDLAVWQAKHVSQLLSRSGIECELKIIKTTGDRITDITFSEMPGKGFFTREIESALLQGQIDLAVHSLKDLPTIPPPGLTVAALTPREDPSDVLLIRADVSDMSQPLMLKKKAVVGTSSARRKNQLRFLRNDIKFKDLRGNVPTRLKKLQEGECDAIILAKAGIKRLGIKIDENIIEKPLHLYEMVPAAGQGAIACQIREVDKWLHDLLNQYVNCTITQQAVQLERKILQKLEGGCQAPVGVHCEWNEGQSFTVRISYARHWQEPPLKAAFSAGTHAEAVNRLAAILDHGKRNAVFFSRQLSRSNPVRKALEFYGFEVYSQSLVKFKKVKFTAIPRVDWVFFSSRNAVKYFFEQKPALSADVKYAVIGTGTESILKSYGIEPAFTGNHTTPEKIADEFARIASGKVVLFPQARRSLRSIQNKMPFDVKVVDLIVYDNAPLDTVEIPPVNIAVLTSPMNAQTFLNHADLKRVVKFIAIGKTTAAYLKDRGIKNIITPQYPNELCLLESIMAI